MTDRDEELAILARTPRVWSGLSRPENVTPGLIDLCRAWLNPTDILAEIGCFAGVSTAVFACFVQTVYAVDPWTRAVDAGYRDTTFAMLQEAEQRFGEVCRRHPNIMPMKQFSQAASAAFADGSLDAVYIDGEHSERAFRVDVICWRPKIKKGGLLMGHDFDQVGGYFAALGLPQPIAIYPETSWVVRID